MKNAVLKTLLTGLVAVFLWASCVAKEQSASSGLRVIATLFPQYDFAKQIAGDAAHVVLLLPPGVEPHSFDPSPHEIKAIREADIFIYTGRHMEPWVDRLLLELKDQPVLVIDASEGVQLTSAGESSHDGDHDHSHDHGHDKDPHIWLDPVLAVEMVKNIGAGFIYTDPDNAAVYAENMSAYILQLEELHRVFEAAIAAASGRTIYYAGHFAFGYFARRYGLEYISPYRGFSPNAEPGARQIAAMIDALKESPIQVVYYEALVEPRAARVIAEETGAAMLLLHPAANLGRDDLERGVGYLELMYANLENLKAGLE